MTTMRIDAHAHGHLEKLTVPPAEVVASCRALGLERVVLIEPPEACRTAYETLPDFVVPVAQVDMDAVREKEIHDCFDWGARGSSL